MRDAPEVVPLRVSTVTLGRDHPDGPGTLDVYAFLVRDGSTTILLDTGVGIGNEVIERLYSPEDHDLVALLAAQGVAPADVDQIVNSHLHFDHCGGNRLFPDTPIFVQQAELDAARAPRYTVPDWVDFPGADYRAVSGRQPLSERVTVVPTPGHTPGHQSLTVTTDDGVWLIVAQAAYTAAEFSNFPDTELQWGSWREDVYVRSLAGLRELNPQRAWFSHDHTVYRAAP